VLVLGSSRAVFVPFTTTQRLETCLCCHVHAFEAFGGYPRALLYDHAKTVVLAHPDLRAEAPSSAPPWHPQGLDVAGYYGVTPRLGRPSRARPKGQVERMRRDVRESCCAGGHGVDLDDLHRQVALWCATVANARGHATTGEVPAIRLARELW
jgi:transposase